MPVSVAEVGLEMKSFSPQAPISVFSDEVTSLKPLEHKAAHTAYWKPASDVCFHLGLFLFSTQSSFHHFLQGLHVQFAQNLFFQHNRLNKGGKSESGGSAITRKEQICANCYCSKKQNCWKSLAGEGTILPTQQPLPQSGIKEMNQ